MDTLVVISDMIDNQNFDTNFYGDLQQMVDEYKYQLLMQELQEELNS
jgi:hypothetical protein